MKSFLKSVVVFFLICFATDAIAGEVAYYAFDETSGTVAHDSVGSVNGTLAGSAAFDPGAGINGGGAISLSKTTGDYVTMGDNFNFTTSFSLQVWVKLSPGDTESEIPVARHWATHVAGYALGINNTGDNGSPEPNGTAHFYATYPTSGDSTTLVNDGKWHQLVGTYDSLTDTTSIFVDGVFQNSMVGAGLPSADAPFMVGGIRSPGGSLESTYTGLVTDVGIWDTALTSDQVASIYFSTLNSVPEPASLVMASIGFVALAVLMRRRSRNCGT
jgi:Concanavalin A-like lectin/glucanases superfamily/PEP-CTERM motif